MRTLETASYCKQTWGRTGSIVSALDPVAGKLSPVTDSPFSVPPGDGPRHFTFHRNGRWLYSLQEEASTVMFFSFRSGGLDR